MVNLCSASAIYGQPELATYSATKFGVRGLTEALELEWRRYGIRVIAMWPLFVATPMVDGMETASTKRLGVHLTAEDVAAAIYSATHPRPAGLPGALPGGPPDQAAARAGAGVAQPDSAVAEQGRDEDLADWPGASSPTGRGPRGGCWFWTNDEHSPIRLGTQGMPLMKGVLTGARHCAVYGLGTKPGAHCAAATGLDTSAPPATSATAHSSPAVRRARGVVIASSVIVGFGVC